MPYGFIDSNSDGLRGSVDSEGWHCPLFPEAATVSPQIPVTRWFISALARSPRDNSS